VVEGIVQAAEKQQGFKKMGQSRIDCGRIVGAGMYANKRSSLRALGQAQQASTQTIGQADLWRALGRILLQ